MKKLNKTLTRQIQEHLGFDPENDERPSKPMAAFLDAVNATYHRLENERFQIERAMETSSNELFEMNQELQLKHTELQALHRISNISQENVDSPTLFQKLVEEISRVSSFPIVTIELLDERQKMLKLAAHVGISKSIIENYDTEKPLHTTLSGAVLEQSMEFLVSGEDHHLSQDSFWKEIKVQTLINIPIKTFSKSDTLGVLSLASSRKRQSPTRLIQWLKTVAAQLASSIEKRNLNDLVLEQQASMVAASRMSELGMMAGGMAHEINNPLAMINTQAAVARELCNDSKPDIEKIKKYLTSIERTAMRIAKIVLGLRSFSRDGTKDPFTLTSVSSLVEQTIQLCAERFKAHDIPIRMNVPTDLEMYCRETQLCQVLLNLLNNAHDAVEPLSEKWVHIDVKDFGEEIEFSVTDSGNGIPAEIQEMLFNPFFTTKEVGKGTGLGLGISHGFVKDHGGKISLDPKSKNTRFIVRLPKIPTAVKHLKTAA